MIHILLNGQSAAKHLLKRCYDVIQMGFIYKATCLSTGKSYVGQTIHSSKHRWNQHVWESKHPHANQSRKLNNAIIKYGSDDFRVEDIWQCANEELDLWEEFFIDEHNTFNNGYNLTKGGKNKQVVSEETRMILSKSLKGKEKNVKDNRKRIEDNYLPKYLKHYKDAKCEGYKISDHPNLKGGSVSFTKSNQTMESKMAAAVSVLDSLNANSYTFEKKKEPKGIQSIPNGYRVRIKDHPVKTFQSNKVTMEAKLQMAIQYINIIYKGAQFND